MNKVLFQSSSNFITKCIRPPSQIPFAAVHYVSRDPLFPKKIKFNIKNTKHKHPRFKYERAMKVQKLELPDFHEKEKAPSEMTPQEIRAKYKERGIQPMRRWDERPVYIASTTGIFEDFVPPEGDGKISILHKEGAKQKLKGLVFKGKDMNELRKIRQFDEDFDPKVFAEEAQKIYIDSNKAIVEDDEDTLHDLVTEWAFTKVVNQTKFKQVRWSFIKTIQPPRVVHVRTTHVINEENIYAQVTVRFHTQQTLAVYDRFGRLMHGSEIVARDVLEYVVFEKHVANTYGAWRVHDKIVPSWMPPRPSSIMTFKIEEELTSEEDTKALATKTESTEVTA